MHNKMKLDYNNLIRGIVDVVYDCGDDKEAEGDAFAIAAGLSLLSAYLKDIATLAVKRNDAELLEICKGLMIVTED